MDISDDTLAHYGVQGMRWGQRKQKDQLSRRQRVQLAMDAKNTGPNRRKDQRSAKTKALGKARVGLTVGALGAVTLGVLSPEPISKGILLTGGILAAVGSTTMSVLEGHSAGDDLLKIYDK